MLVFTLIVFEINYSSFFLKERMEDMSKALLLWLQHIIDIMISTSCFELHNLIVEWKSFVMN